ncbi:OmpA family protein [Herbaspirillum sp. RV1423]|uniref:OmpA family protein n=1 Tax=Herbaspirillum sp. RV1423 TaxID=1443993 RepID=UPI0004B66F10|nr:OmpA family protein [Herbaspirillum sp. RV1423]
MDGGKEQNFWPGFVDALSNVVLVMIFVVVVFVVTLFYYSQKLAEIRVSKMVTKGMVQTQSGSTRVKPDEVDAPAGEDADTARLKSENRDKSNEIAKLRREIAQLKSQQAAPPLQADAGSLRSAAGAGNNNIQVRLEQAKEVAPGMRVDGSDKAVVLHFDKEATELSADGSKTLDGSIGEWVRRVKAQQGKIIVTGVIGSAEFSEARRRAYYRTVAVRNHLIDVGVDKERVVSRVATSENSTESNARVIIQYLAEGK